MIKFHMKKRYTSTFVQNFECCCVEIKGTDDLTDKYPSIHVILGYGV